MKNKSRLSTISLMHYVKLFVRSMLFLLVLIFYILGKVSELKDFYALPIAVWIIFVLEIILRFFPSKLESMGCQKQFRRNYMSKGNNIQPVNQSWKRTALVAGVWLLLNGIIGGLYFVGILDKGSLIIISLAFSVCDIICILFFCPFQTWFMLNRCCGSCRIYNWDFAMMFTPLIFIPSLYTYSLLGCAIILLLRWEITYRKYPERFSAETNACLDCANCKEKLCGHKKQLQGFLKKYRKRFFDTKKQG